MVTDYRCRRETAALRHELTAQSVARNHLVGRRTAEARFDQRCTQDGQAYRAHRPSSERAGLSVKSPEPVSARRSRRWWAPHEAVTIRVNDVTASAASYCRAIARCRAHAAGRQGERCDPGRPAKRFACWPVDQIADERNANPGGREVGDARSRHARGPEARPRRTVGTLSLLLRKAGEAASEKASRVTLRTSFQRHDRETSDTARRPRFTVGAAGEGGYSVPVEERSKRAVAATDQGNSPH